jgi:hypothetical protein
VPVGHGDVGVAHHALQVHHRNAGVRQHGAAGRPQGVEVDPLAGGVGRAAARGGAPLNPRISRGGSFDDFSAQLRLTGGGGTLATTESSELGFRVSLIPGPGPLAALALGGLLARRRRR